ncbi:FUSC family protein [Streptomyces sulfonofaciens]|uniref:FUSC family protein n=1 Tax=Streptomyces sulfonofaciens TaxID=68272 RepID=A0A919FT76_9ACTN|nr:FUSC family protein [Streptomyces sulfonofaciens]GHH71991.1 FUSC family protein [Streptomyces sulfonofaciens]
MDFPELLRKRDPDLAALRRSCRAGIVAPGVFALADLVIGNPTTAVFAALCSVTGLLFVDFGGPVRQRVAQQAALVVAGAVLVCLGTLVSSTVWLAALTTLAVGFAVLFAGVASSALATASTALLAGFIISVSLSATAASVPARLAGWTLAGAATVLAVGLLWPAPEREPLRPATAHACALLALRLRAEAEHGRAARAADGRAAAGGDAARGAGAPRNGNAFRRGRTDPDHRAERDRLAREATDAVSELRTAFLGTPYRPTGLTMQARTLVRLVDQVVWLAAILERTPVGPRPSPVAPAAAGVQRAAADLLEAGAHHLEAGGGPQAVRAAARRLDEARAAMRDSVVSALLPRSSAVAAGDRARAAVSGLADSLEPGFRAHEMGYAVAAIATTVELTVAAARRTWWQRLLGRRPPGVPSALSSLEERAGSRAEPHSVWLHNSVRGAVALGLAVTVAQLARVQHAFWVVFGALAVLRSNAVLTGENAVRALAGTVVGIVVGGGLVATLGGSPVGAWLLLPPAVVFTGLAPAVISFAAGQAGFTATLLILFGIVAPQGWQTGLVRAQDVAIGCGVSVLAGALFWPRGAASELGRVLAEAFSASARYLSGTVDYAAARCDAQQADARAVDRRRRHAAAAARRLDDAFRGFLAERGTKHLPLADVTALLTAVAVLRLTADAILGLWSRDAGPGAGRATARDALLRGGAPVADWYQRTAHALAGYGPVPGPLPAERSVAGGVGEAVRHDLVRPGGGAAARADEAARTAVKILWTADHLDVARRLQSSMAGPAGAVAEYQHRVATGGRRPAPRRRPTRSKRA